MRRTKIVCTIGPSSSRRGMLERLLHAGMDVARLNFSHGTHEEHAQVIGHLRELAQRMGHPLAILQDLCGPKVRLGSFDLPVIALKRGQTVGFSAAADPSVEALSVPCPILPLPIAPLLDALKPGRKLLLDDGKLALQVVRCEGESGDPNRIVWTRSLSDGDLKPKKGVTAPGVIFDIAAVTEKDKADLRFGLDQGIDWIAVSYVRHVADLEPLRGILRETGSKTPLLVKIEKAEAVRDFEAILKSVDGIMVARGDLGVEMPFDEVPIVQKKLILACNRAGKPVITATQMLESMIQNPRPTRAEATDVANAILDGTDAVMLSAETAAGQYPLEAVRVMARIAVRAEAAFFPMGQYASRLPEPTDVTGAVARAASDIAEQIGAKAILCATTTGSTALRVAQQRPPVPIMGVTANPETYHRLALSWGVLPALIERQEDTESMLNATLEAARRAHLVRDGHKVVLISGVPVNNPGTTNLIEVHTVGQKLSSQVERSQAQPMSE